MIPRLSHLFHSQLTHSLLCLLALTTCQSVHAQRDLRDIPTPDPVAERAAMVVGEGFEVNLYASDPMFAKPIHMNFDAQGRLWVASSRNYPQIEPGAAPSDQVVVIEDRNRDGVADHHTIFADDLLIPTGILPGDGGVYVANSTELIHLTDSDGDGRADQRRTILSGFGTEDTHHLLHTLRWAPDGWMHFNQSIYIHSHIETPLGIKHLEGGGVWRFDPRTSDLQIFCKGFVNPWGHVIDAYGQSLVTDGAYFEGINYAFPESVFVTSPGATRWLTGLNPGSPKHSGLEMISGEAMPKEMQGRLITNDFRSHRVCVFEVQRQGSGYRSAQLPELIRTQHVAFRPIDVKMGPDGAIYVADWYNPIIQHGEVDFRDPRRDTRHGRIWRITAKGHQPLTPPRYDQLKEDALCRLLRDSALWVRQFARMELAQRQRSHREVALAEFVQSARNPEERSLRRLEQLWVKLCAREQDAELVKLIDLLRGDDEPRIRALAVRTISRLSSALPTALDWLSEAISDTDDQVVLEAVTGLGQMQTLPAIQQLLAVAERPAQDQFLKFALWNAMRANESIWLEALEQKQLTVPENLARWRLLTDAATQSAIARPMLDLLRKGEVPESTRGAIVELVAEKAAPDVLGELVEWSIGPAQSTVAQSTAAQSTAAQSTAAQSPATLGIVQCTTYLSSINRIAQARNLKPERSSAVLEHALRQTLGTSAAQNVPAVDSTDASTQQLYIAALVDAAGQWQCSECVPLIAQWLAQPAVRQSTELVSRGLGALARMPAGPAQELVRQRLADPKSSPAERGAALSALNVFDSPAAATGTIEFLRSLSTSDQAAGEAAAAGIMSRAAGIEALRAALKQLKADQVWSPDGARVLIAAVRNAAGSDEALLGEVLNATRFDALGWKWSDAWSKQIIEQAVTSGDAARGEAIYRQSRLQCVRCHAIGPGGGAIGPNLVSLGGSSTPEYILQSLIDPNAKVKEGFQTLAVLTEDGRVVSGLQRSRTDKELQLMMADGSIETLATDAIDTIQNGKSLMPAGLVDILKEQELVDLTRFLMELGKSPAYTVDTAPRVRQWSMLTHSPAAATFITRNSLDALTKDVKELVWVPVPATVAGRLPVAELPAFQVYRDLPAMGFARFDVQVEQGGSVQLDLSSSGDAVSMWLDGQPHKLPGPDEKLELTTGSHRLVFGLRLREVGPGFACQVRTGHLGSAVIQWSATQVASQK